MSPTSRIQSDVSIVINFFLWLEISWGALAVWRFYINFLLHQYIDMCRVTSSVHSAEGAFGANKALVSPELQKDLKREVVTKSSASQPLCVSSDYSVETGYRAGGLMVSVMRLELQSPPNWWLAYTKWINEWGWLATRCEGCSLGSAQGQ